tara:strand:- start:1482 stop:1832 length:351 start_codon:yes stop_codon:yes gene_type:complete
MAKMRIRNRSVNIWEVVFTTEHYREPYGNRKRFRLVAVPGGDRPLSETLALVEMTMKDDNRDCKIVGLERRHVDVLLIEGVEDVRPPTKFGPCHPPTAEGVEDDSGEIYEPGIERD